MSDTPILVNNRPFFGRTEEQKQFVRALEELRENSHGETLPYVFLLYGDGGIGKSTLARRFQDIAMREEPHTGRFQALWLDWEDEQWQRASLQVGHRFISAEAVFDTLHEVASRNKAWEPYFEPYRIAREQRVEAERLADAALTQTGGRDELAKVRNLGAPMVARFMRTGLPIGEGGEKLAKVLREAGLKASAEQATKWRAGLERRLRARLDDTQYSLYLSPHQQLARSLAEGLRGIAAERPLLLFLDTYEIVDEADRWLRLAIKEAGPRMLWVLAGRNDLTQDRQFGDEYFKGYANDFPRRLLHYNMRRLAEEDVRAYFAATVPQRPLDEAALEAISRATRGIPLATREAAEIWQAGLPVSAIVGDTTDSTPQRKIVKKMTERYMLHCINNDADRRSLYALALARGDEGVLRNLLNPSHQVNFDLDAALSRLERDYASVHREYARLHDEPELFLRESLKVLRDEDWVREMAEAALLKLTHRCGPLEISLPTLEERCEDEDWTQAVIARCDYAFWVSEEQGWRWLVLRFVEALGYSRELRQGLLRIASDWEPHLGNQGRKRLKNLRGMNPLAPSPEDDAEMLKELERLAKHGWLDGEGVEERQAILSLRRGEWYFGRQRYSDALDAYEQAENGLPRHGDGLRRQLGEALYDLAGKLIWPEGSGGDSHYSDEAERFLPKVVEWLPEKAEAWYRRGVSLYKAERFEEAIHPLQESIRLDPSISFSHNSLGNLYHDLGRYEEALVACQEAIRLNPTDAIPYNSLGIVYESLGHYEEATTAYQAAIQLDHLESYPYYNLADIYWRQGNFEKARSELGEFMRLFPKCRFQPFVVLGVLARHEGLEESITHFRRALRDWENAWNSHRQSRSDLLQQKAIALLCLGRTAEAMTELNKAIPLMLPGDFVDEALWKLLRDAPEPPPGIDLAIAMVEAGRKQAEEKRDEDAGRG